MLQRKQDLLLLEALLLGREIIIVHLAFEDGLDCLFCKVECGIDSLPAKEQAAKRRTERIRHEGSGRPAAKWLRYISATSLGTARPKGAARLRERNQVTAHERWTRGISAHSTMQPSQRDAGVAVRTDIVDTIDELVEVVIVYFGRHREASVLALACWRVRCVEFM